MKKEEFFLSCSRNFSRFLWNIRIHSAKSLCNLQITVSENTTFTLTKFFPSMIFLRRSRKKTSIDGLKWSDLVVVGW